MKMLIYEQPIPNSGKYRGGTIDYGSASTHTSAVPGSESLGDWRLLEVSK